MTALTAHSLSLSHSLTLSLSLHSRTVTSTAEESEIKYNYLRLSRIVHPDKCQAEGAGEASAILNQVRPRGLRMTDWKPACSL